jgi:hypothetical protein
MVSDRMVALMSHMLSEGFSYRQCGVVVEALIAHRVKRSQSKDEK